MKKKNLEGTKSSENIFSEIQKLNSKAATKKKSTNEDLIKQLRTINIGNPLNGFLDNPLKKSFFEKYDELIIEKIKSNKDLSTSVEMLSNIYSYTDEESNKQKTRREYSYTVKKTEYFVENLVKIFLSLEIDYLIHLKELYKNSYKNSIKGKLLNFDLRTETFLINEKSFNNLLDELGNIVELYSSLLRMRNSEWLNVKDEFAKILFKSYTQNKELQEFKDIHTNKKNKSWRKNLFELAKAEFKNNKSLDGNKTLALKAGFEKLPEKEEHRKEFNNFFKSIYEKFLKILPL